jgi:predicted enzyme related to lactoylglutathione lyase
VAFVPGRCPGTVRLEEPRAMSHTFVWVDIPVADLDRAIAFYTAMLDVPVAKEGGPGFSFGIFPHGNDDVAGCLYVPEAGDNQPARSGPLVYLNATGRLDAAVAAVEKGGGKVLQAKHQIGPYGWRAIVLDSEGNRVALHSPN